jgi:hypothetical protein
VNLLGTILFGSIILAVFMMPLHFAGLNKKSKDDIAYIRIAGLAFGWTGVGWLLAMVLAFLPNKKE